MKEPRIRQKAREDRNWLQEVMRNVPGFQGYLEREERRETDRLLRRHLARKIQRLRGRLDPVMAELTDTGGFAGMGQAAELDRLNAVLQKLRSEVEHASYGYSGFFDAVKVHEAELDRLYRFDVALLERVDELEGAVQRIVDSRDNPEALKSATDAALRLAREFDEHFAGRCELITAPHDEEEGD